MKNYKVNGPDPKPHTRVFKNTDALEAEHTYCAETFVDGKRVNRLGRTKDEAWARLVEFFVYRIENHNLDDLQ